MNNSTKYNVSIFLVSHLFPQRTTNKQETEPYLLVKIHSQCKNKASKHYQLALDNEEVRVIHLAIEQLCGCQHVFHLSDVYMCHMHYGVILELVRIRRW
jgi:hypothetical protein